MAENLGAAVLTVSVDDRQFQAGLSSVRQAAQSTATKLGQAFAGAGGQSLTSLNIKLNSLQQELQNVAIGTRRFRELREEIDKTQRALTRANGGGGAGVLGGIGTALTGLGVGAAGIGFLRGSIDAAVELDTITRKLSNTLGPQGTGQALSFTKSLADQLGLSFKTLASGFGSFTAAASASNVPIEQQKELFAAVAKSAQAFGLSNDEINGTLQALQQVAAKGTVQLEELRGQLGDRLPVALAATANGLGITQKELFRLVESGNLSANEFFPALTKGLNDLTAGAGGTATAAQNFQRLANAWDELQTSFGQNLLPSILPQLDKLAKVFEGIGIVLRANNLGLGGGAITNVLGIIPEQGAEAVGTLKTLQQQFSLTEKQANALFTDAVASVGGRTNAFGQLSLSAEQFETVLKRLPGLAEEFREKNKDVVGELKAQQAEAARLLQQELKRRDSIDNQQAAIKSLSEQQKSLAIDSSEYARVAQEIVDKQTRLNEAKKTESQRWAENIAAANQLKKIQGQIAVEQSRPFLSSTGTNALRSLDEFRNAKLAEISAQADLRADPGNKSLIDASQVASANVQLAARKTKNDLLDAFKSAQDSVKSISRSIEDGVSQLQELQNASSGGLSEFMSAQGIANNQTALAQQLKPIAQEIAARRGLNFTFEGGTRESRNAALLRLIRADRQQTRLEQDIAQSRGELPKARNDLAVINQGLVTVNTELANATRNLAEKNWTVNVAVDANSGNYAINLG